MKDLSSIYGLLSYFRKFVPRFSTLVAPISDLMKHDVDATWTEEHDDIVKKVIRYLTEKALLAMPDSSREFVLEIEYSERGFGGVLLQENGEG